MLDIKFIRENPDVIAKAALQKNVEVDVNHVLKIDEKYREIFTIVQKLREERNAHASQITGKPTDEQLQKGRELKDHLEKQEHALFALKEELDQQLLKIPNIPDESVPIGKDESENIEVRKWGNPTDLKFPAKDHVELGENLGIIDVSSAAEVSGARFYYLKAEGALLEFALIRYGMDVLADQGILATLAGKIKERYSSKPFIPVVPPVMIRPDVFQKMARKDPEEERYYFPKDNLFLVGSAEHTLGPLHMNQTIAEKDLPIRYVGFSTSFRREAGSYGKDTKGILRVHQFDKLEIESFTLPEDGIKEQDFIVSIQEYLMQSLEIPYRVVAICTGDMGTPDARQIDIEAWIPSQDKYRETHTSDFMTDYQARRLNTRVRRQDGSEYVYMNDATAFAIPRTIIAILENFQEEDGSVVIPEVLRKYTGFDRIEPK